MIPQLHDDKIHDEAPLPSPNEKPTVLTRLWIIRVGAIIAIVGGILTLWGYFLPMATFSDMAYHPVFVSGDANVLLPGIACLVIGVGIALVLRTKLHWLVFLGVGVAILIGLITHYYFCMSLPVLPPPVQVIGYFDFDFGALLPFVGLLLSFVGFLFGFLFGLTLRKPPPSR